MHIKMLSAKLRPFFPGRDELIVDLNYDLSSARHRLLKGLVRNKDHQSPALFGFLQ